MARNSKFPICRWLSDHDPEHFISTGSPLHASAPFHVQDLYGNTRFNHTQYSPDDGGDLAVGALFLTLRLGSFSEITLSEVNPLDIPEFISNIGGFWGERAGPSRPSILPANFAAWPCMLLSLIHI